MFTSVDSELQEYCAQQLNSKDVSNVQISTSKIPLLQSRAISFSASDHSQSKFMFVIYFIIILKKKSD